MVGGGAELRVLDILMYPGMETNGTLKLTMGLMLVYS